MRSLKDLRATWGELIDDCAERHGLDPALVAGVIWRESRGNPKAVSHCGARGLMQLMPATARRFGVSDSFNPRQNVGAGCKYLAWLIKRFGVLDRAVAGYNAGEGNVDKCLRRMIADHKAGGARDWLSFAPLETREYVPAVLRHMREYQAVLDAAKPPEPKPAEAPAFLPADAGRPLRRLKSWLFNRWGR